MTHIKIPSELEQWLISIEPGGVFLTPVKAKRMEPDQAGKLPCAPSRELHAMRNDTVQRLRHIVAPQSMEALPNGAATIAVAE